MESQQWNGNYIKEAAGNLDLKSRVVRMKFLLHGLNSRFETAEEKFTELEDRAIESMLPKQVKWLKKKKKEQSFRDV